MKLVNYGGFYMFNGTMMQYFEWFLLPKCKLWNEALNEAENLRELGITAYGFRLHIKVLVEYMMLDMGHMTYMI